MDRQSVHFLHAKQTYATTTTTVNHLITSATGSSDIPFD